MTVFEAISLMIMFGTLIVSLISCLITVIAILIKKK